MKEQQDNVLQSSNVLKPHVEITQNTDKNTNASCCEQSILKFFKIFSFFVNPNK